MYLNSIYVWSIEIQDHDFWTALHYYFVNRGMYFSRQNMLFKAQDCSFLLELSYKFL